MCNWWSQIVGGNVYERFISKKAKPGKPFNLCGANSKVCIIPFWIARAAYEIRWFAIGLLITLVVTDVGKIVVGRLRPNFLDVCNPDFSQFNCTDQFGNPRYVTEYVCRGNKHDVDASRYMNSFLVWKCVLYKGDKYIIIIA